MADLPDIPGLDSVEEEIDEGWPCCCCLPVPIVIIVGVVQGYWLYGLIASAAVILVWLCGRLSNHRIKTDAWELSITWPLRTKRIAWADVTGAVTVTSGSDPPERFIQVDGLGKRIKAPVTGLAMARLEASVWQHLRRYGKAGDVKPSEDALSFWLPIPDDASEEMDWEMPRELDWASRARYSLRSGYVMCEFFEHKPEDKPTAIDFTAVTSAQWERNEEEAADLVIESEADSIYVPLDPDDVQSARFLLAVIRLLRKLDQVEPLAIPERVRKLIGS